MHGYLRVQCTMDSPCMDICGFNVPWTVHAWISEGSMYHGQSMHGYLWVQCTMDSPWISVGTMYYGQSMDIVGTMYHRKCSRLLLGVP